MIDISPEIRIAASLRLGAVYYFTDSELCSEEPHHFVMIRDPDDDSESASLLLLLVVGSSQIEKRKKFIKMRGWPIETLVQIPAGTLSCFTKDTVFDCNKVFERTRGVLIEKLRSGELKFKTTETMPDDVVRSIVDGVLMSPEVAERVKSMLRS